MLEKPYNSYFFTEKKQSLLRDVCLVLLALVPSILLFSRTISDIVIIFIGISFLFYSIKEKSYSFLNELIVVLLLAFWSWIMFSSLFSYHSVLSGFGVAFVFIRYILFFCAAVYWLLTERKSIDFCMRIVTITLLIVASDALLQFFRGFSISGKETFCGRLTSFLRRPDIGIFMGKLIFPIIAYWSLVLKRDNKSLFQNALIAIFFAYIIIVISLTGERTATVLAFVASIGVMVIIALGHKSLRLYFSGTIIVSIASFFGIIYSSPFIYRRAVDFVSDIGNFINTPYGQLFKASILSWQKFGFFTGVGIRQFRESCKALKVTGDVTYCDLHSHNIYLEVLSETGLVGLILFSLFTFGILYLLITNVYQRYKTNSPHFISSSLLLGGWVMVLFPISVTMGFFSNWSGILNWCSISFTIALSIKLNSISK